MDPGIRGLHCRHRYFAFSFLLREAEVENGPMLS